MTIGESIAGVLIAGVIGGFLNALFTENGLLLPRFERNGHRILQLGFLGNIVIGAIAGAVSCALAGIFRPKLTLPQLIMAAANALLVAVSGARWLTNESDKRSLTVAASKAAASDKDLKKANRMLTASPREVLKIAGEPGSRAAAA